MLSTLKRMIIGIGTDPQVVAAARAFAIYALPIFSGWLVAWLAGVTDPRWGGVALAAIPLLRVLEGAMDRAIKGAAANDHPPAARGID